MSVEKTAIVALFEMHGIDAHMGLVDDLHTMMEETYSNGFNDGFNDGCDVEDPFEDVYGDDDWEAEEDDYYDPDFGSHM